ncbi:MAG: DUF2808 domain-containing protein [Cyanobacteriota bacterium]|nr:DUF2808 domain-containing protein [Cyanobacteriota bacterium]
MRSTSALLLFCAASVWGVPSAVAMDGAVAAEPAVVATPQAAPPSQLGLTYTSTNPEAGSSARYGLLFPVGAQSLQANGQTWILLFDAELDVQAYRRRLHFCYRTDRAGRLPRHSQCLESIPAQIDVSVGPGEDRVTISTQDRIDPNRQLGLWLDLINPNQPGLFPIRLLLQPSSGNRELLQTVGVWTIRIEQTGFDSPGSAE